jgi:transposase
MGSCPAPSCGAFWAATYDGQLNGEAFVVLFLNNFMKGRRGKVFLVLDGHPSHKAKGVQSHVASLDGRLEFHRLPTDAPDLNPDEFVWCHMKQNESLRQRVEADLVKIQVNRPLVGSFFGAKTIAYADD